MVDGGGDETGAVPVLFGAADLEDEILQNVAAAFGVVYFGVKFDAIASAGRMLDRRNCIVGAAGYVETFGKPDNVVAVAVPDFQ